MVLGNSQMGDLETRYAHLLQPIRDLTKNWDVDIAAELEQYLEEVESITVTFDNGATVMNFAEAALVIQGSISVYSRKVEYLYSLTYQVLELIASKKKQKASSLNEDGTDKDAPEQEDGEEEFLSLDDDVRKEHRKIDLHNDDDNQKTAKVIPSTPMALIPLSDEEKGENPLLSKKGEVVASRRDFRMNTSTPHRSGVMLLDMSHSNVLMCSFTTAATSTPMAIGFPLANLGAPVPTSDKDAHNDTDEGHHSLCSADGNEDNFAPDVEIPPSPNAVEEEPIRKSDRRAALRLPEHTTTKPVVDHFAMLDPHSADNITQKPFVKGKPFNIPASLNKSVKRKKTPMPPDVPPPQQLSALIESMFEPTSHKNKNNVQVPAYTELQDMFWEEHKRRQAIHKQNKIDMVRHGRYEELAEQEQMEKDAAQDDIVVDDFPHNDDDYDDHQPIEINEADVHNFDAMDGIASLHAEQSLAMSLEADVVTSFEDLVKQHTERFLLTAQLHTNKSELEKRVAMWEERIIPVLEEEETHESFDIHRYGKWILDRMTLGQRSTFKDVVSGQPAYEICRLFLATLQLTNNYNIGIVDQGEDLSHRMDSLDLDLLNETQQLVNLAEI